MLFHFYIMTTLTKKRNGKKMKHRHKTSFKVIKGEKIFIYFLPEKMTAVQDVNPRVNPECVVLSTQQHEPEVLPQGRFKSALADSSGVHLEN